MATRQGKVTYTNRAFTQDGILAMSGGLISAMVELITNADDAYREKEGSIHIEYSGKELCGEGIRGMVSVTDHATGLLPGAMETCFAVLGGETSGFSEGEAVRGLFGRGAKDVAAFGMAVFESIRYVPDEVASDLSAEGLRSGDPVYSRLELKRDSEWSLQFRRASDEDFSSLSTEAGNVVFRATVVVKDAAARSMSRAETLADNIRRHALLRDLTRRRIVTMRELRSSQSKNFGRLLYEIPLRTEVFNDSLSVEEFGPVNLTLYRLEDASRESIGKYSDSGVVVSSGKSVFENTWFGRNEAELNWYQGNLDAPQIMQLERERQANEGTSNEEVAVGDVLFFRDRSGLNKDSEFYRALKRAISPIVDGLITNERERTNSEGSALLERDLKDAMQAVNDELDRALREIDEEPPTGILDGSNAEIVVVPQRKKMAQGSKASFTVFTRRSHARDGDSTIRVSVDSGASNLIGIKVAPERRAHDRWSYEVSRFVVEANELGSCAVGVVDQETNNRAEAVIMVVEAPEVATKEPTALEFKTSRMTVSPGNQRHAILRAPANPSGSLAVTVQITGPAVSTNSDSCRLEMTEEGWLEGVITLLGEQKDEVSKLEASADEEECEALVECKAPFKLGDPSTEIRVERQIRSNRQGVLRSTSSGWELTIFALHPALADLLGDLDPTTGQFKNENRPEVRIRFAEAMTAAIVDLLISKEWGARPDADEFADPEAVMATRDERVANWLPRIQRVLLSQSQSE